MKARYIVEIERPANVSDAQMKTYIEDAVASYMGCYCPDDPIFDIDGDTVKVSRVNRRKRVKQRR